MITVEDNPGKPLKDGREGAIGVLGMGWDGKEPPPHIPTLTTALIEDDWQRRRPRRTAGGHVGVGRRHKVSKIGVPHGLTGRDSSVWFEVQHFLWRKNLDYLICIPNYSLWFVPKNSEQC